MLDGSRFFSSWHWQWSCIIFSLNMNKRKTTLLLIHTTDAQRWQSEASLTERGEWDGVKKTGMSNLRIPTKAVPHYLPFIFLFWVHPQAWKTFWTQNPYRCAASPTNFFLLINSATLTKKGKKNHSESNEYACVALIFLSATDHKRQKQNGTNKRNSKRGGKKKKLPFVGGKQEIETSRKNTYIWGEIKTLRAAPLVLESCCEWNWTVWKNNCIELVPPYLCSLHSQRKWINRLSINTKVRRG